MPHPHMLRRIAKRALEIYATRLPCKPEKCRVTPRGVAELGPGGACCDIIWRAA